MNHNNIKPIVKITLKFSAIVSYCILLFWVVGSLFEVYTDLLPISRARTSYYFEPVAIIISFMILVILTRRILLSLILITGFYIVFMFLNAEMMRVFGLVVSPGDIKHSLQIFLAPEIWFTYWKELIFIIFLLTLMVLIILKTKPNKILHQFRYYLFTTLTLAAVLMSVNHYTIASFINKTFSLSGKVIPINLSEHNGFLFGFYYQILKHRSTQKPADYSQETIEKIITKYTKYEEGLTSVKPHVIIFFIEAFADPQQMGIKTSYDPIPYFRKYAKESQSGLVLSPEIGGRSANPEFELLTGLSMRFVSENSIPYIDYIDKPLPSLSREFNAMGYTSHVIHVATLAFFNYKKAYRHLGFDHVYTLFGRKNIEKDAADRYPSESALVDEIIEITKKNESPQFIFSFPNSTHSHWDYDAYEDSDLEVFGEYLEDGKQHLKTYINALHYADKAIGKLIQHYEQSQAPTVVMVLGDHQPSLPEFRQSLAIDYFKNHDPSKIFKTRKQLKNDFILQLRENYQFNDQLLVNVHHKSHQVPYFIWNNFDNRPIIKNTSMNLLSAPLLSISHTSKNPLYNLIDKIYNDIHELHKKSIIGKEHSLLVDEYELLQYDIINGNQFYERAVGNE